MENLEVNSVNKQGARCSKSLCAVQAEQGAAAQAVDAFQVGGVQVAESAFNGVSYSKKWTN